MLLLLMACGFETSLTNKTSSSGSAPVSDSAVDVDDTATRVPDTGAPVGNDTAQVDETAPPDTGTTTDTGTPPETGAPPDTATPPPETPSSTEDPCPDAPDIDCPVDTLDTSACAAGVAAWLPSGRTYTDVQSAIDDAGAGDTVAICPGTWSGNLAVDTADLTLRGYGATATTLDGGGTDVVLTLKAPGVRIAELTVTRGVNPTGSGGGITAGWSDVVLCDVTVTGNSAYNGGGVYVADGSLAIEGGRFDANDAMYQGGAIDGGQALVTVFGAYFDTNTAGYAGGGIFTAVEGGLAVYDTTFQRNRTGYEGGAVASNGSTMGDGACFVNTTFSANEADYAGGAVSSNGWGTMTFGYEGCTFDGNHADFGGGAVAYQQWGTDTSVTVNSTFTGNTSGDHGGAVDMSGGWGVIDAAFYNTTFDGNTALLAGAIQAGGVGTERVLLVDSAVTGNVATWAGGIFIDGTSTIDARNVDFGTGATDNVPDDVNGSPLWGAAATFSCAAGVCR